MVLICIYTPKAGVMYFQKLFVFTLVTAHSFYSIYIHMYIKCFEEMTFTIKNLILNKFYIYIHFILPF